MKKTRKNRLTSLLLALVMILGTISPAFAAGFRGLPESNQKYESELVSKNGKLQGRLVAPKEAQVKRSIAGLFRAPAKAPAKFDETTVKVNIVKHGIGTNEFDFDAVFGNTPDTKVTLVNWDTDETQEATFNKDTQSVTFDNPVLMKDMTNDVYGIEFEGTNVAGKITFDESSPDYSGGSNITTFTLDLYQVRNTDVVVITKTADGTVVANPTTITTNGKITLTAGAVTETIDIPTGNDATETVTRINTGNKDDINNGLNFTIEGLENGVLVDKANNKVYKPEIKVDSNGIDPTEIKFTEKPIVTETEPKIDDPENPGTEITDPDYVKVTFSAGENGTIAENKTYYVFKGVEMNSVLTAPDVTANKNYEFTGWDPALATKYDSATEHVAQYKKGLPTVTTTEPSADDSDKYATITFIPETKKVNGAQQYGTIKTTDGTEVTPNVENNSLRYWVLKTATWKDVRDFEDNGQKVFVEVKADNGTDSTDHPFIGWKLYTDIVNPFDNNFFDEQEATKTFADLGNYTFVSKFKANGYIVSNSNSPKGIPTTDSDGYEVNLNNDYARIKFTVETNNIKNAKLDPAQNLEQYKTEKYKNSTADTTQISVWIANDLMKDSNPDKPTFGAIKPTVTVKNQEYKFWYWDETKNKNVAVQDNAALVNNQYYTAHLVKNGQEITDADPDLPKDEAFKVTLNRDAETVKDVIGTDGKSLYGRTYAIFKDSSLTDAGVIPPTPEAIKDGQNAFWHESVEGKDIVVNDPANETITKDRTFTAKGINDIVPQKPGEDKPNVPDNFVLVEFKQGEHGTIAETETTKYWVNPTAGKTVADVTKPE
ncbi:hypothetical protein [Lagierella massiliensis]|uniref:hypothetical protein n=1 Tax=Lagierella massiliensis TaxID=1689303 RepID=UPI0006D82382|nr:hypothetical protein [Lagierella massiliensis]